jgi:transcriptional regulator with XRE-family HTH domain
MTTKLVALLRERQIAGGLTDAQMAARLHVNKATWIRTRQGDLPVGLTVLCGIMQRDSYPDLAVEVLEFLRTYNGWRKRRWAVKPDGEGTAA